MSVLGRGLISLVFITVPILVWLNLYGREVNSNVISAYEIIGLTATRQEYYIETLRRARITQLIDRGLLTRDR